MQGMQALEMEEAESFLDTSHNRNNGNWNHNGGSNGASKKPPGGAVKQTWRNFGIAAVIALIIFALHRGTSSSGGGGGDVTAADGSPTPQDGSTPSGNNSVPAATTPTAATSTNTDNDGDSNNDTPIQKKALSYKELSEIIPDPEHVLVDDATKKDIATQFGKWHFWDGEADTRPTGDYCGAYQNRDIPSEEFPDESWQANAVFVNHIINDAEQLVARAMEAIFVEYGHGNKEKAEDLAERLKMFHWEKLDLATATAPPPKYSKRGNRGNGGWTTERSFDGLVRRLLHAIMTNDTFTVVLGGHSAAAGHGNHFHQSYMMQFHKIMAPIFARLGVKLVTRNLAQGGLGTLHNSMGMGSLYGNEIDLLLWDSGMTERLTRDIDFYLRQGLLGGNRVPVLWGGQFGLLKMLHEQADADVGEFGEGTDGIIQVESEEQANSVPFAARYLKCSTERPDICKDAPRFCTKCWTPRDDIDPVKLGFKEPGKMKFGGQVKWHPGWRHHQLVGRTLAFSVLQALQAAIQIWSDGTMGGPPLDEDFWHVTDYYNNIRTKLLSLDDSVSDCSKFQEQQIPARVCRTAMKARSLYTPRANPSETSLLNLVKPAPDGYVPQNKQKVMYEGPDVHNTCYDVPAGSMDVLTVISGRRRLETSPRELVDERDESFASLVVPARSSSATGSASRELAEKIVPGKWEVSSEPPGQCDGEYGSVCGREAGSNCPLRGHHDERGKIAGNEHTGWLVMDVPEVKEGIIIIKLFTWLDSSEVAATGGEVNNEGRRLRDASAGFSTKTHPADEGSDYEPLEFNNSVDESRRLKVEDLTDTFAFDYAINGKITTLNKEQFLEKKYEVQRVSEMITLMDDPNFTQTPATVEVAFRMRGCGRDCTFGLSHVYWA